MMPDNVNISLDVLQFWYRAAKKHIARGDPAYRKYSPANPSREEQDREAYDTALKTVEQLKFLENTVAVAVTKQEPYDPEPHF